MQKLVYLDYAATTPCDKRVAEVLNQFLTADQMFANPASRSHMLGWQAEAAVEKARKQVAQLLSADVREIVWTSGATEANNLAIKGVAASRSDLGRHIITSKTEHKAVLDCCEFLAGQGFEVTYVEPNEKGYVDADTVRSVLRDDTILVSLMYVNNETGMINAVEEVAELTHEKGIVFHVDAAQAVGKLPIDVRKFKADLISMCAHKVYGPKGIGALYVRRSPDLTLTPIIHGGGHERGMRSGTLATHQIAAMGDAFEIAGDSMQEDVRHLGALNSAFLAALGQLDGVSINGDQNHCFPGIVNISFKSIDGQLLLSALPKLAISSGSACNSATMAPSHVLKAMGLSDEEALSAIRVSFGRCTTPNEAEEAGRYIREVAQKLMSGG